ncbi:MAG: AgmX/PglI C-terminal domain-containing protein, partial [Ilumatobacteraceae bacterium]
EIKRVVDGHMRDVKGCLKSHGLPTGKLVVEFAIEPDGHVKESKPKEHSSVPAFDGCVAKLFTTWQFPKPKGGVVAGEVYPFQFAAAKAKAPVEGKLDQKVIVSTITGKMPEVKACYDAALKEKKDDIAGTVNVAMVISAEGKITEAKVNNTTTNTPKLDQCIVDHLKAWVFPKPNPPGEVAIIYPFIFDPKKSEK